MNKNAYIAELSQLLFYMAEWDRDAAVRKYEGMLDASEDPETLMKELGSPMKLAVSLSRGYEPSDPNAPQPVPEATPADEPSAGETEPETPPQDKPDTPEEAPAPEEEPEPGPAPAPREAEPETTGEDAAPVEAPPLTEEAPPEPEEPTAAEPAPDVEEILVEAVEFRSDDTDAGDEPAPQPAEELPKVPAIQLPTTGEDAIFSEIFSAATQAQTAVAVGTGAGRPKPRPAVLVFYILACILFGVPVTLLLVVVGLLIFAISLAALLFGVYIFTLFGVSGFPGLGNHLVILGAGLLAATAAIAIAWLGVWFMRTAAVGFPHFLIRFGREHGYTQEGRA